MPASDFKGLADLAKKFGVNSSTMYYWSHRYPDFPAHIERQDFYDELRYDLELVKQFMQRNGLTAASVASREAERFDNAWDEAWKAQPSSVSDLAYGVKLITSHPHKLKSLRLDELKSLELTELVTMVRTKIHERGADPMAGSPSLGCLLSTLFPEAKHVVDLTPSSGYLLDAFSNRGIRTTAVCPTDELASLARCTSGGTPRDVVVASWADWKPQQRTLQDGLLVGVAPSADEQPGDAIDQFINRILKLLPEGGVAGVVVPYSWCESPTATTQRRRLLGENLLESVVRLIPSLVQGHSLSALLVLRKRELAPNPSCNILEDWTLVGERVGKRIRKLTSEECENIRYGLEQEPDDYPSPMRQLPQPFQLKNSMAVKANAVLSESNYRRWMGFGRLVLTPKHKFDNALTDFRDAVEEFDSIHRGSTSLGGSVRAHDTEVGSEVRLRDVVEIEFLQRAKGTTWSSYGLRDDDTVINLLGNNAGSAFRGSEVLRPASSDTPLLRVARLRVLAAAQVDPQYLYFWATSRAEFWSTSGGHIVKRVSRDAITQATLVRPPLDDQRELVSQLNELAQLGKCVSDLQSTLQKLQVEWGRFGFPILEKPI
jgi:hypothetical protein